MEKYGPGMEFSSSSCPGTPVHPCLHPVRQDEDGGGGGGGVGGRWGRNGTTSKRIMSTPSSSTCPRNIFSPLVLVLLGILYQANFSQGGNCWLTINRNGLCSALVKTDATREECCNTSHESFSGSVSVSWSEAELTPGAMFYMHLQGGVPCTRCKESCDGVKCGENEKCMMRAGRPKCVCAPDCAAFRLKTGKSHHKGPVCGSDGRTYKSTCRLLKRSCRRKTNISIAYYGTCKLSCSRIACPSTKRCLLDQNMIPHCVNCSERKCNSRSRGGFPGTNPYGTGSAKSVCGSDGVTYGSICDLRQAACQFGKAIPVAYRGPCKKKATCSSIACSDGQSCLVEIETGRPRCVTCSSTKWCDSNNSTAGPICATDGKTYRNWCELTQTSCSTGIVLETKHFGSCSSNPPGAI